MPTVSETQRSDVLILDYGVGNLFSVWSACEAVGLSATISSDREAVLSARAVIVPGMGAFGDAMDTLRRMDLIEPLRDVAAAGTPLVGICLGLQLFMTESEEFGTHAGLGLIAGPVVRFQQPKQAGRVLKVPHVGWAAIAPPTAGAHAPPAGARGWREWPLQHVPAGAYMYFVHSFYVVPQDPDVILTTSMYGGTSFCSSIKSRNLFACQFHPERSGPVGLGIYRSIARHIADCHPGTVNAHV
jgi:glutamine amidotransferase